MCLEPSTVPSSPMGRWSRQRTRAERESCRAKRAPRDNGGGRRPLRSTARRWINRSTRNTAKKNHLAADKNDHRVLDDGHRWLCVPRCAQPQRSMTAKLWHEEIHSGGARCASSSAWRCRRTGSKTEHHVSVLRHEVLLCNVHGHHVPAALQIGSMSSGGPSSSGHGSPSA